jgi:hypothetical protein
VAGTLASTKIKKQKSGFTEWWAAFFWKGLSGLSWEAFVELNMFPSAFSTQ